MRRFVGLLGLGVALAGCDHFAVMNVGGNISTLPDAGQNAYDLRVTPRDLYTVVWAETSPPSGSNAIQGCSGNIISSILSSKKRVITVTANIDPNVGLPLYAITQDGASSCSVSLGQIYLSPREVLDPGLPFKITGSAIVDDSGSERISEYLGTAVSFGKLLTPLGPQVGVVTAALSTALNSDAAKRLSAETNSFSASKISLSGTPLVSLDPPQTSSWYEKVFPYTINLQEYSYSNQPIGSPKSIGTIDIYVWRTSTIIGIDPVSDGGHLGAIPSYANVSPQTEVLTLQTTSTGIVPTKANLFQLLDQNASVASAVRNLSTDATQAQMVTACENLRQGIQKLGIFNRFDAAAYLWAVYSWSAYSRAHEPVSPGSGYVSPCLSGDEQNAVDILGIGNWPHQSS